VSIERAPSWTRYWRPGESAYVTSFNTGSIRLPPEENEQRYQLLARELERRGYTTFPGEGIGDDDQWPPERSLLILGIRRDDARRLGRDFGQRAIVYGEAGGPAVLLPCEPLSGSHGAVDLP
jgi:hypothetical protein